MTVTTLRPNGTVSSGNAANPWIANLSGTLHGNTSDDSDTTYALGSGGDSYSGTAPSGDMILDLGTASFGGDTINSVTFRVRADGGQVMAVYQRLSGVDSAADSHALTTTTTNYTGATRTTAPGGGSWAQADIDALQVKISSPGQDTNNHVVREVYVDVDHSAGGAAAQSIGPTSISSTESVTALSLAPGSVGVQPASIASAEGLGSPSLAFAGTLSLGTIGSGEDVGSPSLVPETLVVALTSIESGEAVGDVSLVVGVVAQTITPDSILTGETVGGPLYVLYRDLSLPASLAFTETVTLSLVTDLGPMLASLSFGALLSLSIDPVLAVAPAEYVPSRRVSIQMPVPVLDDRGRPT